MSNEVSFKLTGDAAKLVAELLKVTNKFKDMEKGVTDVQRAQKKAAEEARQLERAAKRVVEQNMTPLERFNRKNEELGTLLKKNKISQETYNRAVGRARREYRDAENAGKDAFGPKALGMVKNLAGALGLAGGLAGAVQLVRSEYERLIEVQQRAAEKSLSVAETQERALTNLGAETPEERDAFIKQAQKISRDRGVSLRDVYLRSSDALSARGDQSVEAAMQAVEASFLFAPGDSAAGQAGAGAALDIGRVTGATSIQSLGYLQSLGKQARITDPQRLAVNATPAIMATIASGATPQTGGAMFAALTQGMGDIRGESSRTATIQLSRQIKEFFGEGGGGAGFGAGKTMAERIAFLQKNEQAREAFLADASFEQRAKTPVEELLRGGKLAKSYDQFRKELPTMEAAGGLFEKRVGVREGASLQQIAGFGRRTGTTLEEAAMLDPQQAMIGILREQFKPILEQTGMGRLGSKLAGLRADGSGTGLVAFSRELESRRQDLLTSPGYDTAAADMYSLPGEQLKKGPSDLAVKQAEVLDRLIVSIDELVKVSKEHKQVTERNGSRPTLNTPDRDR